MIACRGKNGWFNLGKASAYKLGEEMAVSIGSKKPWQDVSPIYLQGPKTEIMALLGSLKAMAEGEACGMFELRSAEISIAPKCSGGINQRLCVYCCRRMEDLPVTDRLEPTIEDCAEIGKRALMATCFSVAADDLEASISDLMADLLHLARLNNIDPDHIIDTAQMHFDAEMEEKKEAAHG